MNLSINDSKFDRTLLAFNRSIREYFSNFPKYNEAEIISYLKRNISKVDELINININKIVIEIEPIMKL